MYRTTTNINEALTFPTYADAYFNAGRRPEDVKSFSITESLYIGDFVLGRKGPRVELVPEPQPIFRILIDHGVFVAEL